MPTCSNNTYCVSNTGILGINDNYTIQPGVYNNNSFYLGDVNGFYIYFSFRGYWCLSYEIEGECLLTGKNPCFSSCPDLCDDYFSIGKCPEVPIPPVDPCEIIDFESYFDCDVPVTPTTTPTNTPTPSMTPTVTSTLLCPLFIDATIQSFTPTPNPTPTVTPSSSRTINRDCGFMGDVTFTTIDSTIDCPFSLEFQDCFNGFTYYTTSSVVRPEGGNLEQFMIYQANVDGLRRCISYVGVNVNIIGSNTVTLISNLIGYSNLGQCTSCLEVLTPTPTPTPSITPTITLTSTSNKPPTPDPSNTPTPTKTRTQLYYIYQRCGSTTRVCQPVEAIANQVPMSVFRTGDFGPFKNTCWFLYITSTTCSENNPIFNTLIYDTNAFPSILNNSYASCAECNSNTPTSGQLQVSNTPTPTRTLTPTPSRAPSTNSTYKPHQVRLLNNGCSVCNGGGNVITIYSQCSVFVQGCSIFYDTQGTAPIPPNNYVKSNTGGGPVWLVGNGGTLLNFSCAGC